MMIIDPLFTKYILAIVEKMIAKAAVSYFKIPESEKVKAKRSFIIDSPIDALLGQQNILQKLGKLFTTKKPTSGTENDDRI